MSASGFGAELVMIPVSSSDIAAVGYDPLTLTLLVSFVKGRVYTYEGVPPHVVSGLLGASSPGGYFADNIRDVYEYRRVG